MEFEFVEGEGALAAGVHPAGVDGVGDHIGFFGVAGLVVREGVVEIGEEDGGVFGGEEERFGGSAMVESVEADEGASG
jgi:hypothetical protein